MHEQSIGRTAHHLVALVLLALGGPDGDVAALEHPTAPEAGQVSSPAAPLLAQAGLSGDDDDDDDSDDDDDDIGDDDDDDDEEDD